MTLVLSLAALHYGCSPTRELAANDPYANCADLGELALKSNSRADAEQRMRARVVELGGDTLLFGVRGRAGRLGTSPAEIVERRTRLLTPPTDAIDAGHPPLVLTAEEAAQADGLETAEANAARRRTAAIAAANLKDAPGELWFYGAALRCNRADRTE